MTTKYKMALISGLIVLGLAACKKEETNTTGSTTNQTSSAAQNGKVSNVSLKNELEKASYATGASVGGLIKPILSSDDNELMIDHVIAGFADTIIDKAKMTQEEMNQVLVTYSTKLEEKTKARLDKMRKENVEAGDAFRKNFEAEEGVKKTSSGLLYKIEKEGTGKSPTIDDVVVVNYVGKLVDGREFDSSYANKEPTMFPLGNVIKGWGEGLQLIKEGGKIQLVIPPELAYGDNNLPSNGDYIGIGPQSTLIFDIELVKVENEDALSEGDSAVIEEEDIIIEENPEENSDENNIESTETKE